MSLGTQMSVLGGSRFRHMCQTSISGSTLVLSPNRVLSGAWHQTRGSRD